MALSGWEGRRLTEWEGVGGVSNKAQGAERITGVSEGLS